MSMRDGAYIPRYNFHGYPQCLALHSVTDEYTKVVLLYICRMGVSECVYKESSVMNVERVECVVCECVL